MATDFDSAGLLSVLSRCDCVVVGKNATSVLLSPFLSLSPSIPGQFRDSRPFSATVARSIWSAVRSSSPTPSVLRWAFLPFPACHPFKLPFCTHFRPHSFPPSLLPPVSPPPPQFGATHSTAAENFSLLPLTLFCSNSLSSPLRPICIRLSLSNLEEREGRRLLGRPLGPFLSFADAFGPGELQYRYISRSICALCLTLCFCPFLSAYAEICMPTLSASLASLVRIHLPSPSPSLLQRAGYFAARQRRLFCVSLKLWSFRVPLLPSSVPRLRSPSLLPSFRPDSHEGCCRLPP